MNFIDIVVAQLKRAFSEPVTADKFLAYQREEFEKNMIRTYGRDET